MVNERRGRIPPGIAELAVEAVEGLGIALALRVQGRLATLDGALRQAAVAEGVTVV